MVRGGKRREIGVSLSLAGKPSGCVIWMIHDSTTLELGPFLWFGGAPGEPMPDSGRKVARHTRGDANGLKGERSHHRLIARSRFVKVESVAELVMLLFGQAVSSGSSSEARRQQLELLREHVQQPDSAAADWVREVARGGFAAIPEGLTWDQSMELAHLIDGYGIVRKSGWGDPFRFADDRLAQANAAGEWSGGPAELWASLFLEHRRWRMSPFAPGPEQAALLDRLCEQVRSSVR
jgi:hypothetical protein